MKTKNRYTSKFRDWLFVTQIINNNISDEPESFAILSLNYVQYEVG